MAGEFGAKEWGQRNGEGECFSRGLLSLHLLPLIFYHKSFLRMVAPAVAFKNTGLRERLDEFAAEVGMLMQHTTLR